MHIIPLSSLFVLYRRFWSQVEMTSEGFGGGSVGNSACCTSTEFRSLLRLHYWGANRRFPGTTSLAPGFFLRQETWSQGTQAENDKGGHPALSSALCAAWVCVLTPICAHIPHTLRERGCGIASVFLYYKLLEFEEFSIRTGVDLSQQLKRKHEQV